MAKEQAVVAGEAAVEEVVDLGDSGQVIEVEVEEEPAAPLTVEDYARSRGWKPKEEFSGEGDWRPAQEFLDRGLDGKREVSKELTRLRETTERMGATQARLLQQAEDKAREEERARLLTIHDQAVDDGDKQLAREALGQLAQVVAAPQRDTVAEFGRDNPWFVTDPVARSVAHAAAEKVKHLPPEQQFEAARAEVHKRFPEYAPQTTQPQKGVEVAEPARIARPASKTKTFSDLPAEAQQVARFLAQNGKVKTEDYVREYFNKEGTVG